MVSYPQYETLAVSNAADHVLHVEMNRPNKLNAMNLQFWADVRGIFERIEADHDTRVVILSGVGRMFTAGLDLASGVPLGDHEDVAHKALDIRRTGKAWQQAFTNIEKCGKPVIACVHGACIGGGIEMISACDIRFCSRDAYFLAAEVDIGMAADVGGLQRFPKVVGNQSLVRELAMSGRKFLADEAFQHGFVSRVLEGKDAMLEAAKELALQIAAKSPVAMLGVKEFLNYSRDHTVEESLDYALTWNMGALQSKDMMMAAMSQMMKKKPVFPNLPKVEAKL
mmetsp:Transcript_58884/g.117822  ORF Transcript_58884/g.117822 Transcript_58884/m.117822 type:complete len:282 (-) Transcript_58884:215-1060(-)|eukprot:CAMPEP_0113820600 /NCGR_PEP_ID=MMETSP0328-20130328/1321_1 /TAXON_ID=39455 /ORGANISM="Alexandrium minutum" /LENGTH=281 /DNA_ID=CAMNT_0000788535 /DNA_START=81 /DNA_END=926 /DNA_ORIENTATION=+ /assembly_acc=CAM_ASM_000350